MVDIYLDFLQKECNFLVQLSIYKVSWDPCHGNFLDGDNNTPEEVLFVKCTQVDSQAERRRGEVRRWEHPKMCQ